MTEHHKKEQDDEIIFDLKKVKSWFSKKDKEKKLEKKNSEEGIELDWNATKKFFKKYGTIFLILIPIIITIYLRVQPMYLPATDDWAANSVNSYFKSQITAQVNQQYPNLPDANKAKLVENEFEKFKQQNKEMIDQQIKLTSQQFKERMMYESGKSKYVYLGDIDSYYWLRDARKIIETGHNCDEIDEKKKLCYGDTYTHAPLKSAVPLGKEQTNAYVYSIIYMYKFLKLFNPDITIMQASFYVPITYAVISAIIAFLIGAAIAGNIGGLVASILVSTNPIALSRTMGSDNDPQNILYPLLIVLFFIYTFESKELKKSLIFGTLAGLSTALYAWAWQGWWFIFDFLIGTIAIYGAVLITKEIRQKKRLKNIFRTTEVKQLLMNAGIYAALTTVLVSIIINSKEILKVITGPLWFTQSKEAALGTYWPNVLVTVAEFNPATLNQIMGQMGGKVFFFLGLMGLVFVMIKGKKIIKEQKYLLAFSALVYLFLASKYGTTLQPMTFMVLLGTPIAAGLILFILRPELKTDMKLAILLAIWFAATTYAALKGVRFTLLMVSTFGIAFAITINALYKIISRWMNSELKISESLSKGILIILIALLMIAPVKAGYSVAKNFIPSVNDAWYGALTNIKDNSQPDAIINSWWDFGHWFKYLADRRVTLDGSSQSGPPLYWLGKILTTDDERQAVGILRMLDCGSNNAFDELNKIVKDTAKSVKILNKIVTQDKTEAEKTLSRIGLNKKQITDVIQYTHCKPPEDFFITSADMIGKAGVWGHFGNWNFTRAEMYEKVKGKSLEEGKKILMGEKFGLKEQEAESTYFDIQSQDGNQWITPWPGYLTGVKPCKSEDNKEVLICPQNAGGQQLNFAVNLTTMDVTIPGTRQEVKPTSIVYPTKNGTAEKKFQGNVIGASLILIPTATGFKSILAHPLVANSMFTRLFFMEGNGLRYFDKFDDRQGLTGGRIIVWKVDWEGKDANSLLKETNTTEDKNDPEIKSAEKDIQNSIEGMDELNNISEDVDGDIVEKNILNEQKTNQNNGTESLNNNTGL